MAELKVGDWVLATDTRSSIYCHLVVVTGRSGDGYSTHKVYSTWGVLTPSSWYLDAPGMDWPYIRLASQTEEAALLEVRLLGYGAGMKRVPE